MGDKNNIKLTPEQETLLVTLYCKAQKDNQILFDEKAEDIISRIDYDFNQLQIPKKTIVMMCLRSNQFDAYTQEFLINHHSSVIVHLGCGLDGRYNRIKNNEVEWYDLDMPAVIDLREQFYKETTKYHMISSSVTELTWINNILPKGRSVLIVAEGLFMYLQEAEIKDLIITLSQAFPGCHLVFDAFSKLTAKRVKGHPSIKKTSAIINWGIDNAKEIEQWSASIHLKEERYFSQFKGIEKLSYAYRLAFRFACLIPAARRAHRTLYYIL